MAITELTTNDTQDFYYLFLYINNITGGLFFPIIIFSIWVIFFMLGLVNGSQASRSWIFSSFICSLLSILLGIMNLINPNYIYFFIILLGFGVMWNRFENASD